MKNDIEAIKDLVAVCAKHRITIYPHDGVFEGGHGNLVIYVNNNVYKAPRVSGKMEEVTVDSTVSIASKD